MVNPIKGHIDLSIVIPSMNEFQNLSQLLPAVRKAIERIGIMSEILIVEANKNNNEIKTLEDHNVKILFQNKKGFANALTTGFGAARGKYILTMDADLSHDPAFISTLWEFRKKAEVVIASRYVWGGKAYMPFWRKILSIALNWIYGKILSLPFKDFSTGFKLYNRKVLEMINITSINFEVIEEIIIKIYSKGWKILEIPFKYKPRLHGSSNVRLWEFTISYLKNLWSMFNLRYSPETADYDELAFNSLIPLQRYWQRKRFRIITEYLDYSTSIIDIGCGTGYLMKSFTQIVGMDASISKIRNLKKVDNLVFGGSILELPIKDKSFQTVVCSQVIEHLPFTDEIFKNLNRILVNRGILIIGTPDYGKISWHIFEWLHGKIFPNSYTEGHISKYTRESLFKKLNDFGFEILDYSYILRGELIIRCRKKD